MNTRRQTIWLVSMLSLMVVLSAYYLFTEDLGTGSPEGKQAATDEHGIVVDEVEPGSEWAADGSDGLTEEEAEVLRQLEAQGIDSSGGDYIAKLQYARTEALAEEAERLYGIISDTSLDPGESSAAMEQLSRLEEKEEKMTGIEEELSARFPNVVVTEENERYKVVVQSEKLGTADAVDIVDLVMKTMDVSADRVSVQYVP
jgi:stage III sporulation protein AH